MIRRIGAAGDVLTWLLNNRCKEAEDGDCPTMTAYPEIAAFRARGLRVTPQRSLVFRLVREMGADPPSAETVHVRATREMPSLSLRTVYAILHHLVCTRCAKIKDVFVLVDPVEVPPDQRQGFVIIEQDVVFRGVCAECRA